MKSFSFLFLIFVLIANCFYAQNNLSIHTNDTLLISSTSKIPTIDGFDNDDCWKNTKWDPIDQVWMNYGDTLSNSDFSGKYKITWSPETNLLYFIAKTTDDVLVDGYVFNPDPKIADNYYNFDILEVFIDEDVSGGVHVFNGKGDIGKEWGTNSRNAFSHHIVINIPKDGETTKEVNICDIDGNSWDDYIISNYKHQFNDFIARRNGNEITWEFAIAVYTDKYDPQNPEAARVKLANNKKMSISFAYCDNDNLNENPPARDNFIGSVYVEKEQYNDHWKNADGYRRVKLVK